MIIIDFNIDFFSLLIFEYHLKYHFLRPSASLSIFRGTDWSRGAGGKQAQK